MNNPAELFTEESRSFYR